MKIPYVKLPVFLIMLTFLLVLSIGCAESRPAQNGSEDAYRGYESFDIKRGTNISHWLSQSNRRGEARDTFFTRADVEQIAGFGFDHIRLPVDEEQLWDETGNKEEDAFNLLHNAIGWALDNDLKVIVDLHTVRAHHFDRPDNPLWTDRAEQLKFVDLWRQLSDELEDYPVTSVAYELMNEPAARDHGDWNKLVAETVQALRETEPQRKIVIGSNHWQSVHAFDELVIPENDTNIILSFHFYEPFLLTHHQASWTFIGDYTGPVQYPGITVPQENFPGLPLDLQVRIGYHNAEFNKRILEEMIMMPLEFAKKHNLPVYCGEWGCLPSVPSGTRLEWYSDVRSILEKHEIAWANWDYHGGFGIVDRRTREPFYDLIYTLTSD